MWIIHDYGKSTGNTTIDGDGELKTVSRASYAKIVVVAVVRLSLSWIMGKARGWSAGGVKGKATLTPIVAASGYVCGARYGGISDKHELQLAPPKYAGRV